MHHNVHFHTHSPAFAASSRISCCPARIVCGDLFSHLLPCFVAVVILAAGQTYLQNLFPAGQQCQEESGCLVIAPTGLPFGLGVFHSGKQANVTAHPIKTGMDYLH